MLDLFVVFNLSGLVLFRKSFVAVKGDPIDALIRTVLLENRETTAAAFKHGSYALKYARNNKAGLVFVAVYQSLLVPAYVDDLLETVGKHFVKTYKDKLETVSHSLEDYEEKFDKLLWETEEASLNSKKKSKKNKPAEQTEKSVESTEKSGSSETDEFSAMLDLQQNKEERRSKARGDRSFQGKKNQGAAKKKETKGKEDRVWDGSKKLTQEQEDALNVSGVSQKEIDDSELQKVKKYLPDVEGEKADIDKSDDEDEDEDDGEGWFASTAIGGFFARMTGQKPLSREEIQPAVDNLEKQLLSKNVSTDAAKEISTAVAQDLEGKKLGSFRRGIGQAVKESCHAALSRLLTPKSSIDILRDVKMARAKGKTYTIVFIGVNGVGKSTSLSKVCYYLKQNGLKVLICACDTFRSGAVEQLKVHSRNLGIELFEQGYNKDASSVAANGIKHAEANGFDVVVVDTAGRMQNNEPLMRALTRLIARNRPDLILFVGEALAGNDGRDQLVEFDKALVDFSESSDPRRIDGMILTKFDTIDDKVGAAVSMVHSTGQPIIFVGTGQKYTNLNKLNVSKVVKSLLQ